MNRARRRLTYGGKTAPRYAEPKAKPRKFVQHPFAFHAQFDRTRNSKRSTESRRAALVI